MFVRNALQNLHWRCLLRRTFFGLDNAYMKSVYEEFFMLKYHGGWSFIEAYNLPVGLRRWFLERLVKQFEKENEDMKEAMNQAKSKSSS